MTALTPADNRRQLAELPPLPVREPLAPPARAEHAAMLAAPRAAARAELASALATAGSALLDRREEHRRRAHDIARLRDRVTRLCRRSGAHRSSPPAPDDMPPPDLATVRSDLERCEALLRDLSAAVSLRQVPRGRPTRRHAAEVDRLRAQLDDAQADATRVAAHATRGLAVAQRELDDALAADAARADELEAVASVLLGGWDVGRWAAWEPSGAAVDELRIGRWLDPTTGVALALPCVVPFPDRGRSFEIVTHDEAQRVAAVGLLPALVLRIAAATHGRVRLTLLDPRGGGASFPGAQALGAAVPTAAAIGPCVADAIAVAERAVSERPAVASGASSPARMYERSHVFVVADFPAAYDSPTVEALERLERTGPAGGVHVVLHRHLVGDALGAATALDDATVVLDLAALQAVCGSHRGAVALDGPPPRAVIDVVAHRLRATPPRDAPLPWDARRSDRSTWWSASADELVSATLGELQDGGPLTLWFGRRDDRFWLSEHAIVAAMPGAGRSTFMRNLVLSLAVAYRPDDVRVALIAGRHGTDLGVFEDLPHAQLVSSRTTPAQLRGLVAELVADVRERRELFARLGVRDLGGYRSRQFAFRRRAQTSPLARLVAVIDDYEQLFDGDDGSASEHLLELVEQGGAVGIHLLLVGRNFRAVGMVRRSEVLSRLQQRWALPMAPDDLAATLELGAHGRLLAAGFLDRPGRVVANDHAGADDASRAGRSATLDGADTEEIVRELVARAASELDARSLPATVVLNGLTPPELLDNPHLGELLRNDCWHAADFLEELARAPLAAGGLGMDDWLQGDRPLPLFLGVEDGGRRPAVALLRRRPGEHLVVIGRDHGARAAMLASSLASAALVEAPQSWQAWIADRGAPAQPGGLALERTADELRTLDVDVRYGRSEAHALDMVRSAAAEVADRHGAPVDALAERPTVLVVLAEPDRVRGLAREADGDGLVDSIAGAELRRVLVHGPAVGVHVVIGTTSAAMLRSVLSDAVMQRDVHHRVLMHASDDDSFAVVRSAAAARLGDPTATPPSAVLYDGERHEIVRFLPYVDDHDEPLARPPRHGPFAEQLALVCARLAERLR